MKFLFIQKSAFPLAGVMSLGAVIKKTGWQVDLVLAGEEDILKKVWEFQPQVVAFPVFTGEHQWVLRQARVLKKKHPRIFILLGGSHPTYYPDIVKEKGVDGIIRGEAEGAVLDLLKALEQKKSLTKIKNLWLKKGKRIHKNPLRPLIEDLDSLPVPLRGIYYQYNFLKNASVKQFLTGRGCPYNCTFCSNHLLRQMYQGKGKYLRRHSPLRVIQEIKEVWEKYGFKTISFTDDVFTVDKNWLKEFLPLYRKKIGVPFMVNVTANSLDEELAKMLKKAGCYGIAMGIESGSQEMRFKVLKKFITDKQIFEGGRLAKKYNLVLKTYNILSLPGETLQDAIKTIKINAALKPLSATASLLQPYPDYEITRYAARKGFLAKNFGIDDVFESIYLASPIKGKESQEIENLQAFFPFLVAHPKFIPLVKPLLRLPFRWLFRLVARITYGFYMSRVHRLSLLDKIRFLHHIDPLKV
ncbi:MAG: B12-binding domain-containing radical SAM protein [Patescibacteria group bacterium]